MTARILLILLCCASITARAADTPRQVHFDIPAQPLLAALYQFSTQASVQVVTKAADVSGAKTQGVSGVLSLSKGLGQLLEGTGFAFEIVDSNTIAITSVNAVSSSGGLAMPLRLAQSADSPQSGPVAAKTSEDSNGGKVEEIVVTAQKREERLQDVPMSISVLSGRKLDSSTASGLTEMLRTIPGLDINVDQSGGGTGGAFISARGVANATRSTGSGTVAYYVDGTPYGLVRNPAYPADPNVYDLDRVEFLSGPQGTLYGANALNGVLRILTHKANPDAFELKARTLASATQGGGENFRGDLAVNVPIVAGKLAARAVIGYRDDSGWIDAPNAEDVNNQKARNYRLRLRGVPTDTLAVDLSIWRSELDSDSLTNANDAGRITALQAQPGSDVFTTYGAEINKEFSGFSISSMSSYIDYDSSQLIDANPYGLAGRLLNATYTSKIFAEEINLVSNLNGPWRWSAGVFYRDAKDTLYRFLGSFPPATAFTLNDDFTDTSKSKAVYGEVGRKFFGDAVELAVGLRYFRDDLSTYLNQPYIAVAPYEADADALTPRAILTWKPVADRMIYASYSQGFRSGIAQPPNTRPLAPNIAPMEPDKLSNYELGAKGTILGGALSYSAAAFYIDWQDIQQSLTFINPATNLNTTALLNGESASGPGFELSLVAQPLDGLTLNLNASWNDLTFDAPVVNRTLIGVTILANKGDRTAFSPEYTLSGGVQYAFPFGATGMNGRVSLSGDYRPPQSEFTINPPLYLSEPVFRGRVSFALETTAHWTATLYSDNVTNDNRSPSIAMVNREEIRTRYRPRTTGLQLEYRY